MSMSRGFIITSASAAMLLAIGLAPASAHATELRVNDTADAHDRVPGDGVCAATRPHGCTLRAAIEEANAHAGTDVIRVDTAGTYLLELGGLLVNGSVNIYGKTGVIVDADGDSRVLRVQSGTVLITSLTLTGGYLDDSDQGAGLRVDVEANVHLKWCVVEGNVANQPGSGIANAGDLHLEKTSVRENENSQTWDDFGGGVTSTGGGIQNRPNATLLVEESAIVDNAAFRGGGLSNAGGFVTIVNSTISGNLARSHGAGILNTPGNAGEIGFIEIERSTITENELPFTDTDELVGGAGIANVESVVDLRSTIVAANVYADLGDPDVVNAPDCADFDADIGTLVSEAGKYYSNGYNLIGTLAGCGEWATEYGDVAGADGEEPIDPLLGPLAPWTVGGTELHIPSSGSPAIASGPDCWLLPDTPLPPCHDVDQRGYVRYAVGGKTDIGAYEIDGAPPPRDGA